MPSITVDSQVNAWYRHPRPHPQASQREAYSAKFMRRRKERSGMIRLRLLGNLMHGDGHVSNQAARLLGNDREVRLYEPETQGNVALAEVPSDWMCRYSLKENHVEAGRGLHLSEML